MTAVTSLAYFLALVATAAFVGSRFKPGEWYDRLHKAPWTPPNWIFAPVRAALYIAIGVAGWLVWRADRRVSWVLLIWLAQLFANAVWSWPFFGRHRLDLALIEITLLAALVAAFLLFSAPRNPIAVLLFVPYAVWIVYAASLNYFAWLRNPFRSGA